jgi:hypothetical protein
LLPSLSSARIENKHGSQSVSYPERIDPMKNAALSSFHSLKHTLKTSCL